MLIYRNKSHKMKFHLELKLALKREFSIPSIQ